MNAVDERLVPVAAAAPEVNLPNLAGAPNSSAASTE